MAKSKKPPKSDSAKPKATPKPKPAETPTPPAAKIKAKAKSKAKAKAKPVVDPKPSARKAKSPSTKVPKPQKAGGTTTGTAEVYGWEDDPISAVITGPGVNPILRPEPKLSANGLNLVIIGTPAPPAEKYPIGSAEFRYWAAVEALARGRDFWESLLPHGLTWQPGANLQIHLDAGVDLNAYYDRQSLSFFHDTIGGTTVYSGESPDILCHELGHAVLDALRPQLWNANYDEVAAFHESFGDISALLSALQLPSMRKDVLAETGGRLFRSSRLSRLAEQVGWAIRQVRPDQAEADCLRNAVNSFFYRDPAKLPTVGPVSSLSSEPHSFSRIFTGAFFEVMGSMLAVRAPNGPSEDDLLAISQDAGRLILAAVQGASITPGYFSQVAASMIAAGQGAPWNGRYREALQSAFVRHGILSLEAAAQVVTPSAFALGMTQGQGPPGGAVPTSKLQLSGMMLGLGVSTLLVDAHEEPQWAMVASADFGPGPSPPLSRGDAVQTFVTDLFRRGRVDHDSQGDPSTRIAHPIMPPTHRLSRDGNNLTLIRLRFSCGFDGC